MLGKKHDVGMERLGFVPALQLLAASKDNFLGHEQQVLEGLVTGQKAMRVLLCRW